MKYIKRIVRFILCLITRIRKSKKQRHIIFIGSRFQYLIERLSDEYECHILNPKWNIKLYARYLRYGIRCHVRDKWELEDFYEYSEEGIKSYNTEEKVQFALKHISILLKKYNIKLIVLTEDMLPNSTAIIKVAKDLGIPTVTYMHGLAMPEKDYKFGCQSDYIWVWGQYFKDKFLEFKLKNKKKIFVAGYPDKIANIDRKAEGVLFVGKGFTKLRYADYMKPYAEIATAVAEVCQKRNIEFCYRPHPSEDRHEIRKRFENLRNVKVSRHKSLVKDFREYKYIIGSDSTVLLEAAMYNKIVIQILWEKEPRTELSDYYTKGHQYNIIECVELFKGDKYKFLKNNQCDTYLLNCQDNRVDNLREEIRRIIS